MAWLINQAFFFLWHGKRGSLFFFFCLVSPVGDSRVAVQVFFFMLGVYVFMLQGFRRGGLYRSWFNESKAFILLCNVTISPKVSSYINGAQEGCQGRYKDAHSYTHTVVYRQMKAQACRHRFQFWNINKRCSTHMHKPNTLSTQRATGCEAALWDSLQGADRWALSVDKEASGSIRGHYRDVPTGSWERRCRWGGDISGPLMLSPLPHRWEGERWDAHAHSRNVDMYVH